MTYEKTPVKPTKGLDKKMVRQAAEKLGTPTLIWIVVKRHKFGLAVGWAGVITALYIFPPLPDVLRSLV